MKISGRSCKPTFKSKPARSFCEDQAVSCHRAVERAGLVRWPVGNFSFTRGKCNLSTKTCHSRNQTHDLGTYRYLPLKTEEKSTMTNKSFLQKIGDPGRHTNLVSFLCFDPLSSRGCCRCHRLGSLKLQKFILPQFQRLKAKIEVSAGPCSPKVVWKSPVGSSASGSCPWSPVFLNCSCTALASASVFTWP